MTLWHKLLKLGRQHPRAAGVAGTVLLALAGLAWLWQHAALDTRTRKDAAALAFEQDPDAWLGQPRPVSDFAQAAHTGQLKSVGIANGKTGLVLYTLASGDKASTVVPGCSALGCAGTVLDGIGERSVAAGFTLVGIDVDGRSTSQRTLGAVESATPPLLLMLVIGGGLLLLTRLQTQAGQHASTLATRPQTQFADAIGNDEAKAALNRVKAFLHDPAQYAKLGAAAPRGVLLVGPPGTGKTLLAKALAGESRAHFIAVDGSYFTATYYGAGVAKVRSLFKLARQHAPCVLFIDEVDGIGKRATGGPGGGAESEMNRIINRVLVEMDGFDAMDNVVVVAATNHEENIDEALRRPGRFDMLVRLNKPTLPERQALFELYLSKVKHDGHADCATLARIASGLSPAEIANVVNKAASNAAEQGADSVTPDHLVRAVETHLLGGEVSPMKELLTEATRHRLAYHEAGHALVGHWTHAGRIERVTIEPRGPGLGVTYMTRDTEDPLYAQGELVSRLAMMLAGREAELMVLGSVSSGASDDLKRASELAIQMVGQLGFSNAFGLLSVAGIPKELLGPDVQAKVLDEARLLLEQAQATCRDVLTTQRRRLDALAQQLLCTDVLSGEPLKALLDGATAAEIDAVAQTDAAAHADTAAALAA
ncbi:AAA family ATPase [Ideonella sp. DXS29W]|uniref:AAA family ATPase n=1 Tax=Ideonella lacteola TaxID=2984193 RepID=A0ABU9BSY5_9BURK